MFLPVFALALQAPVRKPVHDHWPHAYDLLDVNWRVALFPNDAHIEGETTNTVKALADNATLIFDCVGLEVTETLIDGKPAAYSRSPETIVVVPKNRTLKTGETVRVTIRYRGKPEAGLYFIPGERAYPAKTPVVYTQGEMVDNRFWIPTYDYPDDKATSEGTIEVPDGWNTLSNGKLTGISKSTIPGYQAFHWKTDQPHATYLISLVAGPYTEVPDGTNPVKTSIFTPKGLESWGKAAFGGTDEIIRFYNKLTRFNYPFAKFAQSAVPDFMYGGMENISAVTQTIGAIFPPNAKGSSDATGLVAHELAHQWFGDTVTCPNWAHAWINEGWASFLPAFYDREKRGQDAFDLDRYGAFQGGLGAHAGAKRPVVFEGYREALDMFDGFIYAGGASRMYMLMRQLGEPKFWDCVGKYLDEYKFQNVDTPQFFASFGKSSGKDLAPFMKQWFYTPAAPDLTVSHDGGSLLIKQPAPYFDLDLDVWILDGQWVKKKVHVNGAETRLDLEGKTVQPVLVDPEVWVMANIHYEIPLEFAQKKALFIAAPNLAARARMLDSMFGELTADQAFELFKLKIPTAAKEHLLGKLGEGAIPTLIELVRSRERGFAKSVLGRLGELKSTPESVATLRIAFESDSDESIREVAFHGLLNLTQDESLARKGLKLEGVHDDFRLTAMEWIANHRPDEARELCLDYLAHPPTEPARQRAVSILGRVKDKPGERRAFEAIAAVLKDSSYGTRSAAIHAIVDYGDKAAIPLLEPFEKHNQVFFRNAARAGLARLRQ